MRAQHDAVLVGGGTARADDPSMTVRDLGITRQPVRVVASQKLSLPKRSKLAHLAGEVPTWLCHGDQVSSDVQEFWTQTGARLIECDVVHGRIDPLSMLNALAEQGITRVFCEGGGSLAAALLNARLVDELVGFSAGVVIGAEGMPSIGALGLARLAEAPRLELAKVERVGADFMHVWRPQNGQDMM
jgi:diaminohydroxyphosphoribosylaminopyrimidine deaminase/5-amino-6-(5-phosphoribosylamino)uracil reductase